MLGSGWEGKEVEVLEGFFTLESKQLLYWCTLTPIDIKKVERVVVFFHGYTGSCAWLEFNVMATMAKLGNCAVIGVDMPGHGRSDGDHVFIDGWHPYVNCAQQFVDKFCTAKVQQWSAQSGKELKMFAMGESMGGGIVMTLSLEQPRLFRLRELDVPCLIMHARGDTVTDPQLSEMLFAVAKTKDKSLKLYENAMHMDPLHGGPKMKELLETVYSDILEWMAQRS